jgi:DNA-binding protein YbaB
LGQVDKLADDAARGRVGDVLVGLRDELADIAAMQKKQAELKVDGQAADGSVEVTVNARGQVVKTVIDTSYFDDHDVEDLGGYITEAAQAAAGEAGRRVAEMLAPITERQKKLPSFSEIVQGLPDPGDLLPGLDLFGPGPRPQKDSSVSSAGGGYDDGDGEAEFPTVKR